MPRLLVANDCPEQVFGCNIEFSQGLAIWAQRLLWQMENDDIIILPVAPDAGYLEYIAELKGVRYETLRVIIAPKGSAGNLSADRIRNLALRDEVKKALAGRHLKSVLPLTPDASIVALARSLEAEQCVPGAAFASQGGGDLANSKIIFRAIAAGNAVSIPAGAVVNDPIVAEEIIADMLLREGIAVIVKKDFGQGCRGNEVLSPVDGIKPNGGRRGHVLSSRSAIKIYLDENWSWLTNSGHHSFVVERYFPDSMAIFAEFDLTDEGVQFAGIGEMLAVPIADGQVIPPLGLSPTTVAEIVDGGRRLSLALHATGYRGMLSADAIVTSDAEVMFTEYNGRITGSTHIYSVVGARIVGKEWMQKRILLERRGWCAPSFQAAVDMLNDSGLAFNRNTHTGVILTGTFIPARKVISYTVVAENFTAALELEKKLHLVSPRAIEALT